MKLFSAEFRQAFAPLGDQMLDATLTKVTPGTRDPYRPTAGTNPTPTDYPCKGYVKEYEDDQIDGTLVKRSDRVIALLGEDLISAGVTPDPNDKIAIEHPPGSGTITTWRIVGGKDGRGVTSDGIGVLFRCHARPAP